MENSKNFFYKAIRELINDSFQPDQLNAFCQDHFYAVYDNFMPGQSKHQNVSSLTDFVKRQGLFSKLIDEIKKINPYQHEIFLNKLKDELQKANHDHHRVFMEKLKDGLKKTNPSLYKYLYEQYEQYLYSCFDGNVIVDTCIYDKNDIKAVRNRIKMICLSTLIVFTLIFCGVLTLFIKDNFDLRRQLVSKDAEIVLFKKENLRLSKEKITSNQEIKFKEKKAIQDRHDRIIDKLDPNKL